MSDEEIKQLLRSNDKPVMTAVDVAKKLDVSGEAVRYRLNKMHKRGEVGRKEAGSSAVVWWVVDD